MGVGEGQGRAVATFQSPRGAEALVLHDDTVVEFGRAAQCAIRFAYAPVADAGVPRVAGRLVVAAERVFVESSPSAGRRSLELVVADRPTMLLGLGEGFSPSSSEFRVLVHGETQAWQILVNVRTGAGYGSHEGIPTRSFHLPLTPAQRTVLAAYIEPLRRGRSEPATHREVAESLSYHPNSVREQLYEIWARMFAAGIPMPDVSEKRLAVAEAAVLHRLLEASDA